MQYDRRINYGYVRIIPGTMEGEGSRIQIPSGREKGGQVMRCHVLYLVCLNAWRGGGGPHTLRLSGVLAPDFLQAQAILSQVPIARSGSRTDLNPTIRDIKNKQPL